MLIDPDDARRLREAAPAADAAGWLRPEQIALIHERDWLRLLGFEVEAGRFGCWRPPVKGELWLDRWSWMDPVGDRWWPVLGAVYMITAVKRVRGMRLVGLAKADHRRKAAVAAPAAAAATPARHVRQREHLNQRLDGRADHFPK